MRGLNASGIDNIRYRGFHTDEFGDCNFANLFSTNYYHTSQMRIVVEMDPSEKRIIHPCGGGRVRKTRDAKGRPIILKRVHDSDTLIHPNIAEDLVKRIKRHINEFNHENNKWMRDEKIRIIKPHIDVIGNDLIAMPVINAPTINEFCSTKRYFIGSIKSGTQYANFQRKAGVFSIRFSQFVYDRHGLEMGRDDLFFLGLDKKRNIVFTTTGDI